MAVAVGVAIAMAMTCCTAVVHCCSSHHGMYVTNSAFYDAASEVSLKVTNEVDRNEIIRLIMYLYLGAG